MKSKIAFTLFTAAALISMRVFAANPPPAPPPPPPPPPVTKTTTISTQMNICYADAKTLAACAVSWQEMSDAGNKVESSKAAWEASGFQNYVAGIRYVNEDLSWCNPPGADATYDDAFKAVAKFLADHPERFDSEPAVLVNLALKSAFPCGKKAH